MALNPIGPMTPALFHCMSPRFLFVLVVSMNLTLLPARAATTNLLIGYCTDDPVAARAAGFDYFEVRIREFVRLSDEDFGRFAARCRSNGLPALTGYWFLPADFKVVGPDVHTHELMNYVRKAFDRCEKLGVKTIVWGSGEARRAPDGFSRDDAFQQLVALAKRIAPEAQQRGITLVVEPLRQAESNTINSAAEGLQWVEAVGHPNFQLLVDLYHLTEEAEDAAIIVQAGPHLRHVHLSNPRGRVFPLRADGFDYQPFFKALNQIGYHGTISVEAKTANLSQEGPQSIAFIREACAAAGQPAGK